MVYPYTERVNLIRLNILQNFLDVIRAVLFLILPLLIKDLLKTQDC